MRKKNILLGFTLLISSLMVGCGDKNIILNNDVRVEQAMDESKVVVNEKDFKLIIESGVSFEPKYIGYDGVYGLTYRKNELGNGAPTEDEDYILKRISEDGIISETIHNIEGYSKLPYALKVNDKNEVIYNNYLKSKRKIVMIDISKINEEEGGGYISNEVIMNSPYAVVKKRITKNTWDFYSITNIINVETGETFTGDITFEAGINNDTYFYLSEKDIVYSVNRGGGIKKITLKDGKIEEEEYDRINISPYTNSNYYGIYMNGVETRILYSELTLGSNTIGSQFVYKVSTKEHEIIYDKKNKIGNFLEIIETLPNGLMICSINGEYRIIKFERDGIKLIYKFDFSNVVALSDEILKKVEIISDEKGEEIIIKLIIENKKSIKIREVFKRYEITT